MAIRGAVPAQSRPTEAKNPIWSRLSPHHSATLCHGTCRGARMYATRWSDRWRAFLHMVATGICGADRDLRGERRLSGPPDPAVA